MLRKYLFILLSCALICACSSTKFVPENEYLLESVEIKADTKGFDASMLEPYVRQKGNSKWFSIFKIPLRTYSLSGSDTTKWINRTLRNLGEEPVIYDTLQARLSCDDLRSAMYNMGYMNATVDLKTKVKGRKLDAIYTIHLNKPFFIRSFGYDIQDSVVAQVLAPHILQGVSPQQFTVTSLDNERKRLTKILNDSGYYHFNKDFIGYTADSVSGSKDVDVMLHLYKYKRNASAPETLHPRYIVRNVSFASNDSAGLNLRQKVLENTTAIEAGKYFCSSDLQKTYNNFSRLGAVGYTDISFVEIPDSGLLDCRIRISPQKPNTISFQPEGTNTAGDLGVAASLTYQNRNLFHGSELFSVQLRGAFEAISGLEGYENHDYEEYGVEAKLQFPRLLAPFLSRQFKRQSTATSEVAVSWNLQNRPEFHRRVFSTVWKYRWSIPKKQLSYNLDLLDLNYVYMPWISTKFKEDYLDDVSSRNAILRYNYEDLFIMKVGFGVAYSDASQSLRANIETAGNFLNCLSI